MGEKKLDIQSIEKQFANNPPAKPQQPASYKAHSTDVTYGSYENKLARKPFPVRWVALFLAALLGAGYVVYKFKPELVNKILPSTMASRMAGVQPGEDYVTIDGKYYKRTPDNVYLVNGQRVQISPKAASKKK